jgi:hypothetical protein
MEQFICFFYMRDMDIPRQFAVQHTLPLPGADIHFAVKHKNLSSGAHPPVRSSGSGNGDPFVRDKRQDFFDLFLDGSSVFL